MAFQKGYTTESNITVNYWSIEDINANLRYKTLDVIIGAWKSEDDKKVNNSARTTFRRIKCTKDKFDQYFSINVQNEHGTDLCNLIYLYAKSEDDFFKDAIDLI